MSDLSDPVPQSDSALASDSSLVPWAPRAAAYVLGAAAVFLIANMADRWAYVALSLPAVYDHDWGRMLRMAGYVPTWCVVALGMVAASSPEATARRAARQRALSIVAAATLGGIAAEVLKLAFRRERPGAALGAHVFRAWSDRTFSTAGFGLPSSHAMVAFAAAAMLARLFPRGRVLWFAIAVGCAATRVLSGAHFLSDVVLAAAVGVPVGFGVARVSRRRWGRIP